LGGGVGELLGGASQLIDANSHSSSRLAILRVNLLVASVATVFSRKKCTIGRSNGIVIPTSKML
jgi:hypothetical protein